MKMIRQLTSLVLVAAMLFGMVPVSARAAGKPGPGRDDAFLELSMKKYGEEIRSNPSKEANVPVLEYTQWQITARFLRIKKGEIVEDKDVTASCTWTTTDTTGLYLTVSADGLATARRASDVVYAVTAAYEGYEAVDTGYGTQMIPRTYEGRICFNIHGLEIPEEDKESLRCLAFDYLASYEWDSMVSHEGKTVAEWVDSVHRRRVSDEPIFSAPNNPKTEEYIIRHADESPKRINSARILHFISAAAGSCTIVACLTANEERIRAVVFRDGTQTYIAYALPDSEQDEMWEGAYASSEANGTRSLQLLADINYSVHEPYFNAGIELYRLCAGQNNDVKVTGGHYGGIVAKYVSYVSGCESLTFNAPSPIQYVYLNNFEELCRYFSVNRQLSYNTHDRIWSSTMYSIEPGYMVDANYTNTLELLHYTPESESVELKDTKQAEQKIHTVWNRRMYFGDDKTDVYGDDYSPVKVFESSLFGGGGDDHLQALFAQRAWYDGFNQAKEVSEWIQEYMEGESDLPKKERKPIKAKMLDILKGLSIGVVIDSVFGSIVDSNMLIGGQGADHLEGSAWDSTFCYTRGDGNDTYAVQGFWNQVLLMGYGGQKVSIEEIYSEDYKTLTVVINGTDQFNIDLSNFHNGAITFYQYDPVAKTPFRVYELVPKRAIDNVDYWKYSCPVSVYVLDENGQVVQELADGTEYWDVTDYGLFAVAQENGEYTKSVLLFDDRYSVQAVGVGDGTMELCRYSWNYREEDGVYCDIKDIPVTAGAVYYSADDSDDTLLCVDVDADGEMDSTVTHDTVITFPEESITLSLGEGRSLIPQITTSSVNAECAWFSSDQNVVRVDDDGYIVAVGAGEAAVYAVAADGSSACAECRIVVSGELDSAEYFTVTGLNSTYAYTGEPIDLALQVFMGELPLVEGVDYEVQIQEMIYSGEWTVTISGLNKYTGSQTLSYTIAEPEASKLVEEKVKRIAQQCRAEGVTDQWEIALWLHDWLIYNAEYDLQSQDYYSRHAAGVLLYGRGVCQSYAEAYGLLLDEFGIENMMVTSLEMNHAWNLVKLDGAWCHIDCTWDDPVPNGGENHLYFGMYDSLIARDHSWTRGDYPAANGRENHYSQHRQMNAAFSLQELYDSFERQAQIREPVIECTYLGEELSVDVFYEFQVWWGEHGSEYISGFSIEGNEWQVTVYAQYWDTPSNPDPHVHSPEIRDEVAADCETTGYSGDTYCTDCGILISEGHVTEPLNHDWENGVCLRCGQYDAVAGDVNSDGKKDSDDAVYLLYHVLFADQYPVCQDCDFTGDGAVNTDDAVYLLYHVLFADLYPLK